MGSSPVNTSKGKRTEMILGYWDLGGRATVARYILAASGKKWEDKRHNRDTWTATKADMIKNGVDLPNLPHVIDGDRTIAETSAVVRYLGRKCGFTAKTESEQILEDQTDSIISGQFADNFKILTLPQAEFDDKKVEYGKKLVDKFAVWEKFLGNKKYFTGENLNWVDFGMFHMVEVGIAMNPNSFEKAPNTKKWFERVKENEGLKAWQAKDTATNWMPASFCRWGFNANGGKDPFC